MGVNFVVVVVVVHSGMVFGLLWSAPQILTFRVVVSRRKHLSRVFFFFDTRFVSVCVYCGEAFRLFTVVALPRQEWPDSRSQTEISYYKARIP